MTPSLKGTIQKDVLPREAAKKVLFLMAGPLRGGGGGRAVKEKNTFFGTFLKFANKRYLLKTTFQNINTGNWQSLSLKTKKNTFFAASLMQLVLFETSNEMYYFFTPMKISCLPQRKKLPSPF